MVAEMKPIICWTHPRSCSTALGRSFMTCQGLKYIHEPFGDAYYFGPERLAKRFSAEECRSSQFRDSTYRGIIEDWQMEDMAQYIIPPEGKGSIAPSFHRGMEMVNPTVFPLTELHRFKHAFLIRNPIKAIPSYYRCTVPPLSERTGFTYFRSDEAGYRELALLIEYLESSALETKPFILDADDLLYDPEACLKAFCDHVGHKYSDSMLSWEPHTGCGDFEKWDGFHDDAQGSNGLKKRGQGSRERVLYDLPHERQGWVGKFGAKGAAEIDASVAENTPIYKALKARAFKL